MCVAIDTAFSEYLFDNVGEDALKEELANAIRPFAVASKDVVVSFSLERKVAIRRDDVFSYSDGAVLHAAYQFGAAALSAELYEAEKPLRKSASAIRLRPREVVLVG